MMINTPHGRNIHTDDSDADSLSSSSENGVMSKLKNLVVPAGRRHSVQPLARSLGQTLDADGCFVHTSESNDNLHDTYDNVDEDENEVNERYEEQKLGNLHGFVNSVRYTDQWSASASSIQDDDSDDGSEMLMPAIGESDDDEDNDGGEKEESNKKQFITNSLQNFTFDDKKEEEGELIQLRTVVVGEEQHNKQSQGQHYGMFQRKLIQSTQVVNILTMYPIKAAMMATTTPSIIIIRRKQHHGV